MPRFFINEIPTDRFFTLTGEDAHHAAKVLRMRSGERITLCDGKGTDYDGVVSEISKDFVSVQILDEHDSAGEIKQKITLFMALPKGDKMEFIIQKATELGVSEIVPFLSKNCVSRPGETTKKVLRWQKIAAEAAKQCGRGKIPTVSNVLTIKEVARRAPQFGTALFFYEKERENGLKQMLSGGFSDEIGIIIGAEGGFTEAEADHITKSGFTAVSLGTRILRCETAPITAISAILYASGNI